MLYSKYIQCFLSKIRVFGSVVLRRVDSYIQGGLRNLQELVFGKCYTSPSALSRFSYYNLLFTNGFLNLVLKPSCEVNLLDTPPLCSTFWKLFLSKEPMVLVKLHLTFKKCFEKIIFSYSFSEKRTSLTEIVSECNFELIC